MWSTSTIVLVFDITHIIFSDKKLLYTCKLLFLNKLALSISETGTNQTMNIFVSCWYEGSRHWRKIRYLPFLFMQIRLHWYVIFVCNNYKLYNPQRTPNNAFMMTVPKLGKLGAILNFCLLGFFSAYSKTWSSPTVVAWRHDRIAPYFLPGIWLGS